MENNSLNYHALHTFIKGFRNDNENHAESEQSYVHGENGRLYSHNGKLSFSSLEGTIKVYENPNIKKYLGWCAFDDELIMFTKCDPETEEQLTDCHTEYIINLHHGTITDGEVGENFFSGHYTLTEVEVCVPAIPVDEDDFTTNISCAEENSDVQDYGNLFSQFPLMPLQYCPVFNDDIPVNNREYKDGIWSMKFDTDGQLTARLIWFGNLNLPMNGKICTAGVNENNFYKRVYFTDYENYFRVINLKDRKLSQRLPSELNLTSNGALLNPQIIEKRNNGTLPAMSVLYLYRLITENGQVSDFSPASKMVKINKEDGPYQFSGGDIKSGTTKSVLVGCFVPDHLNFSEIELIAVEYEAQFTPTAIRYVGRQPVAFYVEFEHFGSESLYTENITLADLFSNSITWGYCSDIRPVNNKMLAVGLRNDPLYVNSKNVDIDFALHGFHWEEGETHDCLLNPKPTRYNYIDTNMSQPFMFVKKKIYRSIMVIGSFSVRLMNKETNEYYEKLFTDGVTSYTNYTADILSFLNEIQLESDFEEKFPNLVINDSNGKIIFDRIDLLTETDLYNYELVFSTPQVIVDYDNAMQSKNYSWPSTANARNQRLVYGGVSNGWFRGNGIRVTIASKEDNVLSKNSSWHNGTGPVLQLKEPTLKKGVMKGEIYRIGIQWYKNGNRLFTTILGDLKIPDIGQVRRELDENGDVVVGTGNKTHYINSHVDGDDLIANRLELRFDVRISCEMSRVVDSYQIVYVERTPENRTIVAQGITSPMHRMIGFDGGRGFNSNLVNMWNLPYYGGPVIDYQGLLNFDAHPNNEDMNIAGSNYNWQPRITTHRKLMNFDSPDLIHDLIGDAGLDNAMLDYLCTMRTDHDLHNIVGGYDEYTTHYTGVGVQIRFPDGSMTGMSAPPGIVAPFGPKKFSQKMSSQHLALMGEIKPFFVNASVFSNMLNRRYYPDFVDDFSIGRVKPSPTSTSNKPTQHDITHVEMAEEGEVIGGYKFNENFDISNNAAVLSAQGWWWQTASRISDMRDFSSFQMNNISAGRRTLMVKTQENFYDNLAINQTPFTVYGNRSFGTTDHNAGWDNCLGLDAYIVANIKRNNENSVYGGRTEYAYSRNEYIPMSEVMPVIKNNVTSQVFYAEGDVYCTLFVRNKNGYRGSAIPEFREFNYRSGFGEYTKYGAWCYAVVLETMVEPRLNYTEEFYRLENNWNFNTEEKQNPAYFQINNLRKSLPKPLGFKDDPNQANTIAVSNVKLNGDYYDAYTQFPTNEFYELEKEKGSALNIAIQNDQVYVIQELGTSQVYIDEKTFITPDQGGEAIQVKQGDGQSISGHKYISRFGTSVRRAIIESPEFGFTFFDERKKEFVRINKALLLENDLALHFEKIFSYDDIVDTEGFFDFKFKESNIRIRTKSGNNFILSYNEVFQCFNGIYRMDNDIYPVFKERVLAPYANSAKLAQLFSGNTLQFFEQPKKDMVLSVITAMEPTATKIEKGIAVNINLNYPINKITFETSLGQANEILGTHMWYKIREGVHTVPANNKMDTFQLRGEWLKVTLNVKSLDNRKIDIFSIINYLRNSYK